MSIQTLAKQILPLKNVNDLNQIISQIPDSCRVVMIGEASHGTHDFYQIRAELTKQLILQKGFNLVAVESDWPDALQVNQYFTGQRKSADDALSAYKRFPTWMWRNTVVKDFVEWMKHYNDKHSDSRDFVGFYGLDVYSLQSSRDEVIHYLDQVDKELAKKAREQYACFDKYGSSEQSYAYNMSLGMSQSCETAVLNVLNEMLKRQNEFVKHSKLGEDAYFYALQNAKVIKGAEKYYRNMFKGGATTWNIRDLHMKNTLIDLMKYKEDVQKRRAKAVVWAHNSHLGDARETEMGRGRKEWNLGQLVRQHFPREEHFNIGFTTHHGTVTAANNWHDDPHFMKVRPSMEGSYERLYHDTVKVAGNQLPHKRCITIMSQLDSATYEFLTRPRLERAIGVIYRPKTERWSHYFEAILPRQFDCVIHVDATSALIPLEMHPQWKRQREAYHEHEDDIPETFPFGL